MLNLSAKKRQTGIEHSPNGWMQAARILWGLIALLTLTLFILGTPGRFAQLSSTADWRSLAGLGLSAGFYAGYLLFFNYVLILTHIALAGLIFIRRPDEWIALFVAFTLVANGALFPLQLMETPGFLSPALWNILVSLITGIGLTTSVILLFFFPDGWFVPRWTRWSAVIWLVIILLSLFLPESPLSLYSLPRPVQISVLLFFSGCGIYAQMHRYESVSSPTQRQQTKWALLGLTAAVFGPLVFFLSSAFAPATGGPEVSNLLYQRVGVSFFSFSLFIRMAGITFLTAYLMLFPITFAISILRYRLWDIDILIRRTLIYTALMVTLALIYFVSVFVLQGALVSLTGESRSGPVTIISTLSIIALFTPLRYRIQNNIDRRFYREKYDTEKTLAAFSASLRDEVDLDSLNKRLLSVVESTMHPEHVLLWLNPSEDTKPRKEMPQISDSIE